MANIIIIKNERVCVYKNMQQTNKVLHDYFQKKAKVLSQSQNFNKKITRIIVKQKKPPTLFHTWFVIRIQKHTRIHT